MTDTTPSPSPAAVAPAGTATTRLIHRAVRGAQEWWRSAVVYVNEPPLLHAGSTVADVEQRTAQVRAVSRLGAQAVRVGCPPLPGEAPTEVLEAVEQQLIRAHRAGVRVVLRVEPLDPRDEASARYWLARGADGLDLGPVSETEPVSHARYRELHALLAEHARHEDTILSTRLTPGTQSRAAEMLHEDWLHHLVDADLLQVTDPPLFIESVTDSLRVRDALGTPGAWLVPDVTESGSPELALSAALVTLALPGAVYLRQGIELGLPVKTTPEPEPERTATAAARVEEQRGVAGSQFETVRAALRLRADHRLGDAALAWVEGLGGPLAPTTLAFLSGEILVMGNFGPEPAALPADREVLLSSAPIGHGPGGVPLLPAGAAAWLWLEPQIPERDPRARR